MGEDFVKVAETKDIQASQIMVVEVNGEKVCLSNVKGKYYAIGNVCTPMGGPLAERKLESIYSSVSLACIVIVRSPNDN
jgi:nitrite reductase/ring-hydroxylating ferredoxin subunit